MLVKDVISLACEFTDNKDLIENLNNDTLTEEQSVIIDSLLNCFNLINEEISTEYVPIIKREVVKTSDFKVNFDDLSYKVLDIIDVKDKLGRKVKFKVFNEFIVAIADKIEVSYSIHPEKLTLSQENNSTLPERVFAYGVAREFFFMQSMFDDADIWEERFKNSLSVLTRKKHDIVIPRRRWI